MELYSERGFEQTTVAAIAERAGLTERTFFRHFADKREVLFQGSAALNELMTATVAQAPPELPPLDTAVLAIEALGEVINQRDFSRERQRIIDANPELQERELTKLAAMAVTLTAALQQHGVPQPAATLAAESAIAIFRVAFGRWISEDNHSELAELVRDSLAELKSLTAAA